MKVTEEFLHFIWKNRLFYTNKLITSQGEKVEVIETGIHNFDAGPDFFNAKIKIGNTTWAGNVEIHVKSSDWRLHNHCGNKAYDSVILQVVLQNDAVVCRNNKSIIPTLELKFNEEIYNNYEELVKNKYWIPCEKQIKKIDSFIVTHWLTNLTVERLEEKSKNIYKKLEFNKNHWEETFYQLIVRSFGAKTNAEPFEWLAISLPLTVLAKHKNNLFQLEALLFGQAGFLNDDFKEEYYVLLKNEYEFLKKKHSLKPIGKHLWKFLRLRPLNFPTIRIAQFAGLIYKSSALFSKIIESKSIEELHQLFDIETSAYWKNHYNFGNGSKSSVKKMGKATINTILINTVVPFYFVYGEQKGNAYFKNKAIKFLEQLPAEKNSLIENWKNLGIKAENAYDTQALIQLKNKYCNLKKCLNCQIGNKLIIA